MDDAGARRTVEVPQGAVEVRDVGEGPVLVFVHGLLVDGQIWGPVVDRLAGRFRCIVPDLPLGAHRRPMRLDADLSVHGQARLIPDLLDAMDLTDVTLVGNDTGGALCQLVVAERPPRVARLVLTDCDAFEVFPPAGFGHLTWAPKVPGLPAAIFGTLQRFPSLLRLRWAYGALTHRRLDDALLRSWAAPGADPAVRRDLLKLLDGAGPQVTLEVAKRLAAFDGDVLVLWSRDDRFFPAELGERLAGAFRDARLEWVDGAGLLVPLDVPDALADAIVRWHPVPA